MTALEDRLRATLQDMAEETRPVALLPRLDEQPQVDVRQRRLVLAGTAAAAAVVLAVSSLLVLRLDRPSIVDPVVDPPKVFRLSGDSSEAPGRAVMAVTLARPNSDVPGGEHEDPLYLLPASGGSAIHVPGTTRVPYSWSRELSADGTRLIRQNDSYADPRLELVQLETGQADHLRGALGYCPQLSPDNGTVAVYGQPDIRIVDVSSGASRTLYPMSVTQEFPCGGLGWSPDGRQLVVRTQKGSVVIDRQGTVQRDLHQSYAVNNSMSWSPDGRLLLTYDRLAGHYEVVAVEGGAPVVMRRPADAQRPLGWAGERVVWLAGQPGGYRLLTTDQLGGEVKTWMAFDIGDRPISVISWSRDLSGTASE